MEWWGFTVPATEFEGCQCITRDIVYTRDIIYMVFCRIGSIIGRIFGI